MTTYNKTTLKTFFETNDVPTGTDYGNLIDSQINVVDTVDQSISSTLIVPELVTPRVSAATVVVTNSLSIPSGTVSANNMVLNTISASAATFTRTFSTLISAEDTYTGALRTNGIFGNVIVVSAVGTTQATAATITGVVNRGKGVVDGQTTGFKPPSNFPGLIQYLYNEGPSANLWPPVGGTLNGLAVNVPFPLPSSAMVTVVHLTASAIAVK